jgi:hypothetical protein
MSVAFDERQGSHDELEVSRGDLVVVEEVGSDGWALCKKGMTFGFLPLALLLLC